MAVEIVTGYTGNPHITSKQDSIINAGAFGTAGKYILSVGNELSYELKSNTLLRINDGYVINQGRLMGMDIHDYEELDISVGLSGSKRCDLVVIHYSKDASSGIEKAELKIIEGTAGDAYTDPTYLDNDLINSDYLEDDVVLYRVKINGLNVESVEQIAKIWYLDTGKREDLIDDSKISYIEAGGPPKNTQEPFYMRLKGNECTIGGSRYISVSYNSSNPTRISFDKKYAPKRYNNFTYSDSYNGSEYKTYVAVSPEGHIDIWRTGVYGNMQLDLDAIVGTYSLD